MDACAPEMMPRHAHLVVQAYFAYFEVVIRPLTTNGLIPADDFPTGPYEAIHERVARSWGSHVLYDHYAAAWNAVAYRFHGAVDAADLFQASLLTAGSSPTAEGRYHQDKALADFFGGGFSTFESTFYALHSIGAFLDANAFSLATPKAQQQVSPKQTSEAYRRAFPGDPIFTAFEALFADPAYQEGREIRNILTHRTAPGRRMYVGIGEDDAPPTEWKLNNIPLDASMVPNRRRELARMLTFTDRSGKCFRCREDLTRMPRNLLKVPQRILERLSTLIRTTLSRRL